MDIVTYTNIWSSMGLGLFGTTVILGGLIGVSLWALSNFSHWFGVK